MTAITLRKLPAEVARAIERLAKEKGTSLNRTVIAILQEVFAAGKNKSVQRKKRDLSHLAGTWTEEQAREMEESLREQRKVDPELWK